MTTNTETTGTTEGKASDESLLALLGLLAVLVVAVAAFATVFYGFAYEATDWPVVTTTDTSGVIETADAPGGQSFVVTFDGAVQEGGPTEVTVLDPAGEIKYRTDLAPGVERVELPQETGEGILLPGMEYASGEYEIVATHGNEVHGRATVEIRSDPLLPHVPLDRLFGYGLVFGVLAHVALFVGDVHDE